MPGTTIPRGNVLITQLFVTSITPVSVAANMSAEQSFTIPGLQVGDYINGAAAVAQTAGIIIGTMRVTAPNTLAVQFGNLTGGALTPVAGNYGFVCGRAEVPGLATNML